MTKLNPQESLEEAYEYECNRSHNWKLLAQSFEHNYNLAIIERDTARTAIKIVVLGIVTCMLGVMFIMYHYGVKV